MHKSFYIKTFGCQMNEHDSTKMASILTDIGFHPTNNQAEADLVLFNTCTVREHAHHKAISEIGRAISLKRERPDMIVGVCGCVAQLEKGRLFDIYPKLDIVFGPDQISKLPEMLKDEKAISTELIGNPDEYNWTATQKLRNSKTQKRISAFVTIMKGCNNCCTFCIVPHVRGHEISRPMDDIVTEINMLVANGVKEVTLLGQNVNSYSSCHTDNLSPFVKLIQKISTETNILRIRYTSPHPKDLCDDLMEEHAANPKLCRHMHLPLQSGSDSVLRAMKRSYNKKQFLQKTTKLREKVDGIDITTDIIVGFPGETEKDFKDTLEVVKNVQFDGMFAFKYSTRPGTKASMLKDDVPQEVKEERLQQLLELNAEIWKEKTVQLFGTVQEVLVEGVSKKTTRELGNSKTRGLQMSGRTFANKIVNFSGNLNLVGHIVSISITDAGPNSLKGKVCLSK